MSGGGRKIGWVVRLVVDRAFGFIQDEQGDEYFMHRSNCSPNQFYDELQREPLPVPVSYAWERGAKGLKAIAIKRATAEEAKQLEVTAATTEHDNRGNR